MSQEEPKSAGEQGTPFDSAARSSQMSGYARLSESGRQLLRETENGRTIGTLPVEEERERMRAGHLSITKRPGVKITEHETSLCKVYLIRPENVRGLAPVFFFIHGGGWVLGDLTTHASLLREIALGSLSTVAFIDYPRAPEHPFPLPLEACLSAVSEVLDAADSLGVDGRCFAIGGDSSGGNLAAALLLRMIERKLLTPCRLVLLYPALDPLRRSSSHRQYANNPNLGTETMGWFWEQYLGENSEIDNPEISPLRAGSASFSRFPPSLIITCEYDILRDEGEELATSLIEAGVDVTAVRWLGALHGFVVTPSLVESTSAQSCIDMVAQYIRQGFGLRDEEGRAH